MNPRRKVVVTGGAGFIGSQVIRDLQSAGAEIHVIDNLATGDLSLLPENIPITEADINTPEAKDAIIKFNPTGIIHLAALHYIPYCNENPEETVDTNLLGTQTILDAAGDLENLQSVVFSSSAAVYAPQDHAHSETDPVSPTDIYGKSKAIGEDLLELFHERTRTPVGIARLFNTYGPRETNPHLIPAILNQLEEPPYEIELGNLSPERDFIHVRDVSSALVQMLTEHRDGFNQYNIGSSNARSVRDVVEIISDVMDTEITIAQDDDRTRESDRPHLEADITKTSHELNWEASVQFEDGIKELLHTRSLI